ncbi:MAG: hypothetical protein RL385_4484 [Pseudomonadota bacterium]|jgi:hypothetical protein
MPILEAALVAARKKLTLCHIAETLCHIAETLPERLVVAEQQLRRERLPQGVATAPRMARGCACGRRIEAAPSRHFVHRQALQTVARATIEAFLPDTDVAV